MARIRKEDHPRILRMIEVEHRKVPDIAMEFGCTPANIYALVAKLRRGAPERAQASQVPLALDGGTQAAAPADDMAAAVPPPAVVVADAEPDAAPVAQRDANVVAFERADPSPAPHDGPRPAATKPPAREPRGEPRAAAGGTQRRAGTAGVGARLAKPGFGLMMRTPDGEENLTPFRSLDDLLSAIKPILRATANSSEPVWFSLQPVDLASIEVDAA